MRAVIKSGHPTAAEVRALSAMVIPRSPSPEAQYRAELEARLADAEQRATGLEKEIERLTTAVAENRLEGFAKGQVEGRKAAEQRADEMLQVLETTAGSAAEGFKRSLSSLETVAAGLASLALGRIIDDPAGRQDLVVATVRRALSDLSGRSLVSISVSRADFADASQLRVLEAMFDSAPVEIHALDDLASGGCRVKLRLGEVDLDLDTQTTRLRKILDSVLADAE